MIEAPADGPPAAAGGAIPAGPSAADLGRPDFEIGLTLAGAISAGAYTAGVIDFLVQALQEWEKERGAAAPGHRVRIRTIAGASAGAIVGALGLVALKRGLRPVPLTPEERDAAQGTAVPPETRDAFFQQIRCVLPGLYGAWVERPRMVARRGEGLDLLGSEDLGASEERPGAGAPAVEADAGSTNAGSSTPGLQAAARPDAARPGVRKRPIVRSLLNAALLDEIADAALRYPGYREAPGTSGDGYLAWSPGPFPFLSETMHVFMTVTNLRGIPFDIAFGQASYGMLTHGDRLHYRIAKVGMEPGPVWKENEFLRLDTVSPLDADHLPDAASKPIPRPWAFYGGAAIASGAFPGGLAPRLVEAPFSTYGKRQYPLPVTYGSVKASFPAYCDLNGQFRFLSVDGGVVNNNPFDFVEYALWDRGEKRKTKGDSDRAVIMVAPFPEPPTFLSEGQPPDEFGAVIRALLPTLLNQARFRASELGAALDKDERSRFLISPRRSLRSGPRERYPIACGLLGGFGGFLDEAFRVHDYQLGRRNCQAFLKSIFSLPRTNPAFPEGAAYPTAARRNDHYDSGGIEFTIVPLFGEAQREVGLPPWPQMSGGDFQVLMRRIAGRFDKIKGPLIDAQVGKSEIRGAAWFLLKVSRQRILNVIELTILADLVRRNQIRGWDLPKAVEDLTDQKTVGRQTDDVRLILAYLVKARISARPKEIAAATHLDEGFVKPVLDALGTLRDDQPHRVLSADGAYRLQMHEPVGQRALPIVGAWIERFFPQSYRYA